MPIIGIILFLIALYTFWDYVIYLIGGCFVLFALLTLALACGSHKESKLSAVIVSLIIALISGGIGYKIIDYNSNKITSAEQEEKASYEKQEMELNGKIEQLSSEEKELYNKKYLELLNKGKTDSEAKKAAYSEIEKYHNKITDMNKRIDELDSEFKELFNEKYQAYLLEGLNDNGAKEKALNDVENRQKEIKDAKEQEEKRIAKEKEIAKKIAAFNDEEKKLFDSQYATYTATMDDITAREKAISDVKNSIEENKKRATREFLENEQPFKKEADARSYSSAYQLSWKVHKVYAEVMSEYATSMCSGSDDTRDVRAACLAYYSGKGAEDIARYEAEKKDLSLDKAKEYMKSRDFNETAEEAEKKIRSLASWCGANLE